MKILRMKIYRVSYSEYGECHHGYSFHESKRGAQYAAREWCKPANWTGSNHGVLETILECFTIRLTQGGVIGALNTFAGHNNNG